MKIIKDKKIIILILTLCVFTIGYFIAVNKISYAFDNNYDAKGAYNKIIETIEKCAIAYGEKNLDLFEESKIIYIKVQDLIDSSLLLPNESGNILNPTNEKESLNANVIKLKYENKKITVEVDS